MNYFLILVILIAIISIIFGMKTGVLKMAYGIVAWIFVFWFINFATPNIIDYLYNNTDVAITINEKITERLHEKYESSETEHIGTGKNDIYNGIPLATREEFTNSIQDTVDMFIASVADTYTEMAIKGIATILAIVIAYIVAYLVGKLIGLIGILPGLHGVNRLFGACAGLLQALMIVWIIMFVADCFPASALGSFVLTGTEGDQILLTIYENNLIKLFV